MKKLLLLAALALLAAACAHHPKESEDPVPEFEEDAPLKSVSYVDLDRYQGRWYMIANIPYFIEAGNVAVYVEYRLREDGTLADNYTARDAFDKPWFVKHGDIEVYNPLTHAEGRITFLKPLWQDYSVVFLDKDYRYTVIAHPSRNYAWVFSREPTMPDDVYAAAIESLRVNGFDTNRVLKIRQFPEDEGKPGYQ